MLVLHISFALISLIWSAATWFAPSTRKLHINYGLIGGTLASGTFLVVSTHQAMLQACVTGLFYVAVTMTLAVASQRKLASIQAKQ